ncbi:hypothetical protein MSAN_02067800 [Mycena sanguinolenta]|uniref:DUF6535 domain-containing protein n=1 Tax=Mycena sanguinolenta TaxID=230812 RepID=A0A8H7CL32_9AGAR|nr:hypothetical protein MSAN_02067800 [Mycena sanguinolenta]
MQSSLFSASLTVFVIESYEVLQPDSGDLVVAGITQISQQLAAITNRTFVLEAPPPSRPTTGSLWCNALWFTSLSLSLTCALLATLVEQWAREFLHKTAMRPSPSRRARIFSVLYFGLKYRMHAIVNLIPFFLHASLLFFVGLVAFLACQSSTRPKDVFTISSESFTRFIRLLIAYENLIVSPCGPFNALSPDNLCLIYSGLTSIGEAGRPAL